MSYFKVLCKRSCKVFIILLVFSIKAACSDGMDYIGSSYDAIDADQKQQSTLATPLWTSVEDISGYFPFTTEVPWRIYVASSLYHSVDMWSDQIQHAQRIAGKKKSQMKAPKMVMKNP